MMEQPPEDYSNPPPIPEGIEAEMLNMEQEDATSAEGAINYLLKMDIPDEVKSFLRTFFAPEDRNVPLANIKRENIPRYLDYFDSILIWFTTKGVRIPANITRQMRLLFELRLTRAVDFGERKAQITVKRDISYNQKTTQEREKKKKGFFLFRRGGK